MTNDAGAESMNIFTRLCYRIGLACGVVALLGALVLVPAELGSSALTSLQPIAEQIFRVFGLAFMWIGFVLLVAAIIWLAKTWSRLGDATKIVIVLALLAGSFASAYLFHWLFPKALGDSRSG
jgi:hypothetical protein